MANTFKFGNGNWAVKDGYALAYNDENNNFKPLPFDFTRASSATTLNRQGLIETVPSGKPRIDFTDNTSGHLLLEPSRTNKVTYSEDQGSGTNWYTSSTWSVTTNTVISPDGSLSADTLTETTSNGYHSGYYNATIDASYTGSYTISAFLKKNGRNWFALSPKGASQRTFFNLENGTLGTIGSGCTAKIENYGNGWYRCSVTCSFSSEYVNFEHLLANADGSLIYQGDGTSGVYIWGCQAEAGSYATSYIPTEGTSKTRVVDDIELILPNVDSFNSSSGFSVIAKFDIGSPGTGTSAPFLQFNDDTSSTYIGFASTSTIFRCRLNLSGTAYLNSQTNAPRTQRNSLFVSCDSSGWSQGANGSTNHTGTNNASVFNRLASITFLTSEVYGGIIKISELLVYNTRLTNTELQNLTS